MLAWPLLGPEAARAREQDGGVDCWVSFTLIAGLTAAKSTSRVSGPHDDDDEAEIRACRTR